MERKQIGEKIYVSFIESDRFKTNHISFNFIGALGGESASKNALLARVLKRGSKNHPTMAALNRALDFLYSAKIYSTVYKIGEAQVVTVGADMLEDKYAPDGCDITGGTVSILEDVIFNPLVENGAFREEFVAGERINLISEIASQIDNKTAYAQQRCTEIMCADEKFAVNRLGTKADAEKIDGAALYSHYAEMLASYTVEIFCIGRLGTEKDRLSEKFKSMFAGIERKNFVCFETDVIKTASNKGEIVEKMPVSQGKLAMGFRLGASNRDENFAAYILFNEIYGGSPNGKLFENVREKLSLCYYCHSSMESAKGLMYVSSGIEVQNKPKALDEILKQLEEVRSGRFTEKELDDARLGVINAYNGIYDNAGTIEFWYIRRLLCGIMRTPEQIIEDIKRVVREDVTAAAKSVSLDTVFFLEGTETGGNGDD